MTFRLLIVLSLASVSACSTPAPQTPMEQSPAPAPAPEARSLSGQDLVPPVPIPNQAKLEADLAAAEAALAAQPDSAEALIWVGRRQGYLWRYRAAIDTFTRGIERFPADARFYRHRGHRYLTVREFAKAEADFTKAAALVAGVRPAGLRPMHRPSCAR